MNTKMLRVWDWPTRLFHWLLACTVLGLFISGNVGGNWMEWHFRFGHLVLALLLFRISWGFVGGYWSLFSSFVPSPAGLRRFVLEPTTWGNRPGHNPLGALSVLAMLAALAVQVASGLLSDDEIAFSGPLVRYASGMQVELATWFHTEVGKVVVLVLVLLHLVAIVFYSVVKKKHLVKAMLTGDQEEQLSRKGHHYRTSSLSTSQAMWAVVLALVCSCVAVWVASLRNL